MKEYTLVPAAQRDLAFLRSLHRTTMKVYVEKIWGWDEVQQEKLFQKNFSPEKIQIIKVKSQQAGVLSVEDRGDELFVSHILLLPDYQSAGLGKIIVQDLMGRGLSLSLTVLRSNLRAKAFYERLGFVPFKEDEVRFFMRWTPEKSC